MTTTTTEQPARRDRPGRRGNGARILASLAVLALAGAIFTVSSLALFTDTEQVTGNAFTTGSVDLLATPATAVVTAAAMAPGDQVTAPLTVRNSGTLEFRYSMDSTTTEDVLAGELVLTVKDGVSACDDANWSTDGTTLFSGVLGSTGTSLIIGSSAQGAQAGDRVLAAGASEVLCFNVTLPLSASNASEGQTSTATFTFDAEQTANNP
jgi:predicted ribosomally synthesized peptide with SipW-like signal peptide